MNLEIKFDKNSPSFAIDPCLNMAYLKAQERRINEVFENASYISLADIYGGFDIPIPESKIAAYASIIILRKESELLKFQNRENEDCSIAISLELPNKYELTPAMIFKL